MEIYFKNDDRVYSYTCVDPYPYEIERFLQNRRYKKSDINEGCGLIDFKKEYIDFIGKLNRHYNSIYWWANTVSCKGTFASNLCKDIFNYYCLISLIKSHDRNFIVFSSSFILNTCIDKYCRENDIECKLLDTPRINYILVHFKRCCASSLYFLLDGWRRKFLAHFYFSKTVKKLPKGRSYYIIRSWIDKRSFSERAGYSDLYFGSLPEYLKQKTREFIILGGTLTDYRDLFGQIKRIGRYAIIPQEFFVAYFDYLKVLVFNFMRRPKIVKPITFYGLEVTDLVKESLRKDYEYGEINKNLIYYYYIKGLLKKIKVDTFAYPFENQAWEKMSIFAIREYSPKTKIIGYAHSSFRPYLLNYFYAREEQDIAPLPDKIVTVGKEFKMILEELGNYKNKVELSEGCALRNEYIFKKDRITRNKNGKILAALSMDINYSVKLFRLLYDVLAGNDKYKVILRSHPFMPVEMIIEPYNLRLANNFQISKGLRFEEDLKDTSLLVYTDTTASMDALICGVPVVHLDIKEPLSIDPLFNLNSLKWTVSDKEGLCRIIDYVSNMDEKEYLEKYNDAMAYLRRYFYPVEEKYLREFIT